MLSSCFIFNNGNTPNRLIFDPQKGAQSPQNKQINTYCDVKSSKSMVQLHPFISIYNVETMFGSRFIFNNGNTLNGLISDPKG